MYAAPCPAPRPAPRPACAQVSFAAESGATLRVYYRTTVYVANESLANPKIVSMLANLTVTALLDWEAVAISSAAAQHVTEWAALPPDVAAWDGTVAWYVQNYGSLATVKAVYDALVSDPVAGAVSLLGAGMSPLERWYAFSADVDVQLPDGGAASR